MRTILVDAKSPESSLHRVISPSEKNRRADHAGRFAAASHDRLAALDACDCCLNGNDDEREAAIAELEAVFSTFPAAVIDLGVARSDPRMVRYAAGRSDLLVVRYGQTERKSLLLRAALRAADRTVAGVILTRDRRDLKFLRGVRAQ